MKNIPNYILYGEEETELFNDYLHIESIQLRSQYTGGIFRAHQHHNLYQFFFISLGGGYARIEGKEYILTENMVIHVPPLTIHEFNFFPDTNGWVLTIPDVYIQNILKDNFLSLEHISQKIIFPFENNTTQKDVEYLFSSIAKEHAEMDRAYNVTLRCLTTLLLTKIIRCFPPMNTPPQATTSRKQILLHSFQNMINEKFKNRLSVTEYANELHITPTHLNRVCRAILNISASELIYQRSLMEAKRLLIYTSMTITEISYDLGYCDAAHFSKFFHTKSRQKPSDFRRAYT